MLKINNPKLYESDKVISYEEAIALIAGFKSKNKKVGLCHGGFDLLHPGHVKHLESAKKLCDVLFVSITSDRFVSVRKGANRPVYADKIRAYMVVNLKPVDYVVISDFETAIEILKRLRPDYYIKGSDYVNSKIEAITAEREAIASAGGEIKYTKDPKLATTGIIDYLKSKV
ncbi:adenylyltransferase/cytidyltransferase family protein [Candidatus Woesearchaeota archaeon]|nr:adenylyltransferase/cytidyltransferase family protein [Candidatus Woesearchaeota archaeon]